MDPFKPYEPRKRTLPPKTLTDQDAEALALKALAFIAGDEELMPGFITLTGCGADDLRFRLADRAFLGAVLDFILGNEATIVRFAESEGIPPETPMLARMKLG